MNSLAVLALVGGRLMARPSETRPWRMSPREQGLVLAKDIAVGAVVVTGLASAAGGVAFVRPGDGARPVMKWGQETRRSRPPRRIG